MKKDLKQIIDSYKYVEIPEIELESKIISKIRMNQTNKQRFSLRTALLVCLVLLLTSTVVFALSKIIYNEDGSHTLINEAEDKQWTLHAKTLKQRYEPDEYEMFMKFIDEIIELQVKGDEARVGYFKYSKAHPELFTVLPARDTYDFDDKTMATLKDHKDTPDYLSDVITKLQEEFGIDDIVYTYTVNEAIQELIKAECVKKSTFGEIYTDIVAVERIFNSVTVDLLSTDMDKFFNTEVFLSDGQFDWSMCEYEIDYETVMIDDRFAMLSKRSNYSYALMTEVNGIGISIITDPRGNTDNIIELAKKLIEVLENY